MTNVLSIEQERKLSCNRCRELLPVSCFSPNNTKRRGYQYSCRECTSKYQFSRYSKEAEEWMIKNTHQTCRKCEENKLIKEYHKNARKRYGIEKTCKKCQLPHRRDANGRFWAKNGGRDGYKTDTWGFKKHHYGITKEQFFEILAHQYGVCAICKIAPKGEVSKVFHVDHNHKNGEVRGILCGRCNAGVGMLGDSITILRNAINYLEERGSYGET